MPEPQPTDEITPPDEVEEVEPVGDGAVPWHGVLAPEGINSGDGRRFAKNALRVRPLPLPLTWQKTSDDGHKGNVTVAKIDRVARCGNEMRAVGSFLTIPEADEVIGLIAEFGKFGVSIDADDATFEMNEDDETVEFTSARIASACIVPIPAFAEAWAALGEAPEGFMDGEEVVAETPDEKPDEAMVASAGPVSFVDMFKDLAPGKTEDGPGWLTHPVDTDRLRDYWVRGPGAAKIGWGVPGDFNRCRVNVAEYIKPQYLNGYCANRHYDALGFWPGRPVAGETDQFAGEALGVTERGEAIALVASAGFIRDAKNFSNPGFQHGDERLVLQSDGSYACPTTVDGDHVYGHLARWGTCHIGMSGVCTTPPHSTTGYANFLTGATRTDEGIIPTGRITIGTGHAGLRAKAADAMAHYDNTGVAVADITVGEDVFGIWFSGQIKPGVKDEVVDALATSGGLSGDWRYCGNGVDDLVAALAVNVGGFPVQRVAASVENGQQMALVASGYVERGPKVVEFNVEAVARAVVEHLAKQQERKDKMAAIAARVNGEK